MSIASSTHPNPHNAPHQNLVEKFSILIDTREPEIVASKHVRLREPIEHVQTAHVASVQLPMVLDTIVAGFNDQFMLDFGMSPFTVTPTFSVSLTVDPGFYNNADFAVEVAAQIQSWMQTFNDGSGTKMAGWTVTGSVTANGNLQLLIDDSGATGGGTLNLPSPTVFDVQAPTLFCKFPYYGLPNRTSVAPVSWSSGSTLAWVSPLPMVMTRTHYLSILSDLGLHGYRTATHDFVSVMIHIPTAGVAQNFVQFLEWTPNDHVRRLQGVKNISSFRFDVADDEGRSVLSEFAYVPLVCEIVLTR